MIGDNNVNFQVREQPPQIQTTIREVPGIELDVVEELPHTDDANTMTSLENALLEKFGHHPENMNETQRNQAMEKIRPNIKNVHAHLPRSEPNKADSPVKFETYVAVPKRDNQGNVIVDDNGEPVPFLYGLQTKVKWEVEVEVNGKLEKIQLFQQIRTPSPLPRDMRDLDGIEHTKHTALLYVKTFKKLHKQGLMGDQYQLDINVGKAMTVENLVKNLRSRNHLDIKHYPNPGVYSSLYRAGTGLSKGDGPAYHSEVRFGDYKISLGYSEEMDIKGRKLKEYKAGDDLPNGAGKAAVAMTKYVKVNVPNPKLGYQRFYDPNKEVDAQGVGYGTHIYQMASKATISGPPISSYENMAKSSSPNIKQEIGEDSNIEADSYHDYEAHLLQKNLESFEKDENQLRYNLLESSGKTSVLQALFLNDSKVNKLAGDLSTQFQMLRTDNTAPQLKQLYDNSEKLKKGLEDLREQKAKIEKRKDHLQQLGPKSGANPKEIETNKMLHKALLGKIDTDLKDVNEKLTLYGSLEQEMGLSEAFLRQKNLLS